MTFDTKGNDSICDGIPKGMCSPSTDMKYLPQCSSPACIFRKYEVISDIRKTS
jgi:hypothetical protein